MQAYSHIPRYTPCLLLLTLSSNHLCIILRQIRLAQARPCFTDTSKLHLSGCSEIAAWNQMSLCLLLYQRLSLQEIRNWPDYWKCCKQALLLSNDTELHCKKNIEAKLLFHFEPSTSKAIKLDFFFFFFQCRSPCWPFSVACVPELSCLLNDIAIPHLGPRSSWPLTTRRKGETGAVGKKRKGRGSMSEIKNNYL